MKNVVLACGLMFFLLEICLSMPFSINVIFSCELEGAAVTYLCEAFYFSGEYIDQVNEVDQVVDAVLSAVEEQATRLFFLAKLNEFERDLYGPADKLAKQIINKTRNMINAQQSTLTQLRNAAHCLKDLSKLLSLFKDVQMLCEARDVVMAIDVHKAISKILDLNYAVFADNQGTVELNRAVLVSQYYDPIFLECDASELQRFIGAMQSMLSLIEIPEDSLLFLPYRQRIPKKSCLRKKN